MRNGDKEKQIKQPKEIIRHDYSHLLLDTPVCFFFFYIAELFNGLYYEMDYAVNL